MATPRTRLASSALTRRALALLLASQVAGCQEVPFMHGGALQSYKGLREADAMRTDARIKADVAALRAARTVRIVPTVFASSAQATMISAQQRALVANAVSRSLCLGLSERFTVVAGVQAADLTVRAVITGLETTSETAAGISKGIMLVPSLVGVPAPVPRIPLGRGSLSVEGEATDPTGRQAAAMVWSKGADIMASSATVSTIGDAYSLAGEFGDDFTHLVATGESPFGTMPSLPSMDHLKTSLGADPKFAACRIFGPTPGVGGLLGTTIGLPPEWTDNHPSPDR